MAERIIIVLETKGEAYSAGSAVEVARILREMATRMEDEGLLPAPRDTNGNVCGSVTCEHAFEPL